MLNNQLRSNSGIDAKNNFEPHGVIFKIIQFISIHLQNFKINKSQIDPKNIEESYNNQLSMYLNAKKSDETFQFQHEFIRTNSRKPDIGVPLKAQVLMSDYESVFDIECKRLNTQLSKVKQYVSGNTGGIERFKRNLHGTDLPHSAMIGYIENETNDYWFNEINGWIKNQINFDNIFWTENEYLSETDYLYFKSEHQRINSLSEKISLFHFFHRIKN
jgi:hypothetical protein